MGLFQQAYLTYEAMEKGYVGKYEEGKQPLAPVSHLITAAQIEITLDMDGNLVTAVLLDKNEAKIIIPVTEESAGRTAAPAAHPLCDQLAYVSGIDEKKREMYIQQMENWIASEFKHPKLLPVLTYVKSGTMLQDLKKRQIISFDEKGNLEKEKQMVRWRVLDPDCDGPEETWRDLSLFRAYEAYYAAQQNGETRLCMVSGKEARSAVQHPKGVVALNGNAKLISANDSSGFTYRGRFTEDWQAATVSYEVSQKAHAALKWLVANQKSILGGRAFICWNPQGIELKRPHRPLMHGSGKSIRKPSDYHAELHKTLHGARENLPKDANAVIAAFDAATSGRLSITYYNELQASDFLQRLHDWDESCCWWLGNGTLASPFLEEIVNYAYGTERTEKGQTRFVTDDRVLRQQVQRMIACRLNGARMPADVMQRLVNRASNPQAYSPENWKRLMFVTCAVIQKYNAPMLKEDLYMEWSLDRKERSFQFGRLLAAMDRAEADYYYNTGDDRQTNAIKSMSAYKQTPWNVFERINAHLEAAYLPRMKSGQRNRYYRTRDAVTSILIQGFADDLNKPLAPTYLIGYELQRNEYFKKNTTTDNEEE